MTISLWIVLLLQVLIIWFLKTAISKYYVQPLFRN